MAEHLKDSTLPRVLADILSDFAELVQKEIQLAKTELSSKVSTKIRAGAWMGVAGVLGLVAALILIEAVILGIASFGIPLHWSCVIVAACLIAAAVGAYLKGRADAAEELTPTRTVYQVKQDIRTAKEQLT